uniref:Uncharacterized protein n=2 Tax=Tetraselmis sp. GSL018 TaxID=582737 RepID=A0A061R608_9CHLO|mmetsp:Transcript_8965/g.21593  ORF Transcript_8965/g.21593 Transcript_8965/m.21593 type:complete len:443 (-) Transcript_8965:211-1539(-)
MTRNARKAGNKVSLKDFHETVPGAIPLESCLPSKPTRGGFRNADDQFENKGSLNGGSENLKNGLRPETFYSGKPYGKGQLSSFPGNQKPKQFVPDSLHNWSFSHHHPTSGLAPGAAGYSCSFPESGLPRAPDDKHNPHGQAGNAPQQWRPSNVHPGGAAAGQPASGMVQLHGPARSSALQRHAADEDDDTTGQQISAEHGLENGSKQWAEQTEEVAKAQLAMSKSSLVDPAPCPYPKGEPAVVKPNNPNERPVLKLLPRTKSCEEGAAVPPDGEQLQQPLAARHGATAGERPRLNLKPRSKPVSEPALADEKDRKPSLFGNALPRELVLDKRGSSNPTKAPAPPPKEKPDGGWHMVHHKKGHGHSTSPQDRDGHPFRLGTSPVDDPFFGDSRRSFSGILGGVDPVRRGFGNGGFSGGLCALQVEESPLMKRGLPTRSDDFLL